MKLSFFLIGMMLFTTSARASVEAVYADSTSEITNADEFTLHIKGEQPTEKEVADAVAKRIRHSFYKRRATIDDSVITKLPLDKAVENLSKADGQFKGLPEIDDQKLLSWIEDKLVREEVYKVEIRIHYMGKDGVYIYYLFLPTDLSDPVLAVNYNQVSAD